MAAIFGICRQSEIAKKLVQDVQIEEDRGVIRLHGRRTKGGVLVQWHEIHSGEGYDVVNIFKSYIKRSGCELGGPNGRFFLAASAMAENGATKQQMMMSGGWKNEKAMQGYIEQSTRFQADSAQKIVGESPTKHRKVDRGSVGNLFSNCIFNGAVTINVS